MKFLSKIFGIKKATETNVEPKLSSSSLKLKFLHWNVNGLKGKNVKTGIKDLITNEDPDIVVITESHDKVKNVIKKLGFIRINHVKRKYGYATKFIEVYSKQIKITLGKTKEFDSIVTTSFEFNDIRYLIHGVHFSSKKSKGEDPELHRKALRDYRVEITETEKDLAIVSKSDKGPYSIVLGDFNCNPFEDAMNNNEGFHALDLNTIHDKKLGKHKFYLNPSLSPMGGLRSTNGVLLPIGTYYYENKKIKKPSERYWNMLDGVIISPELADNYLTGVGLKIIASTPNDKESHVFYDGNTDVINSDNYSDHLPITFTINF